MFSKKCNKLQQFTNNELLKIRDWFKINKLSINITKTKFMTFSPEKKCNEVKVYYDKISLETVKTIKYLGVFLDENLNWSRHIAQVKIKLSAVIGVLYRLKNYVSKDILKIVYYSWLIYNMQ